MPPHNSRLRKYGLVALALGDINVDLVVGTRSTGRPDFAKLVESFEAKNVSFVAITTVQHHDLDGTADAQRAVVLCPV